MHNVAPTPSKLLPAVLRDVGHGSHLCAFYETTDDLIDLVAPFFAAGALGLSVFDALLIFVSASLLCAHVFTSLIEQPAVRFSGALARWLQSGLPQAAAGTSPLEQLR